MPVGYSASASSGAHGGTASGGNSGNTFGEFNYNAPSSQAIGATKLIVIAGMVVAGLFVIAKYGKKK